jgi:hypothetical protein
VDTKKKELVGEYANAGREWQPTGQPVPVNGHDFPTGMPKAIPYGASWTGFSLIEQVRTREDA